LEVAIVFPPICFCPLLLSNVSVAKLDYVDNNFKMNEKFGKYFYFCGNSRISIMEERHLAVFGSFLFGKRYVTVGQ